MKIREGTNNGKKVWILELGYIDGKRKRQYFEKRTEAQAALADLKTQKRKAGDYWISLKSDEKLTAAEIIMKAKASGLSLSDIWDQHVKGGGKQIVLVPISKAVEETVRIKNLEMCRPRYVDGLKGYLKMFSSGRDSMPIAQITSKDVEDWFAGRKESPAVRNANLGRLSAMFAVAVKNGWCATNPCDNVYKPKVERKAAEIFTVRQAARALLWTAKCRPRMLGYLALSMFVGVRPEELEKIGWESIKESGGKSVVVVSAEASKVRQRRISSMEVAAKRWLDLAKSIGSAIPVPTSTRKRYIHDLREALRMDHWTQDILRHTAASYLLAKRKDAASVALELGNSATILLRHYRALVSDQEAERFWNLIPNPKTIAHISKIAPVVR